MAKYNKIFWLDDRPDFLELFFRETSLKREELFARVTWAYDFEDGAKKVQGDYDLYILDGDFPDSTSLAEKKMIDDCLEKIRTNEWSDRLLGLENPVANNFARFYTEFLTGKNNVVVLSMSTFAPLVAFPLGLPFYCKGGLNPEETKDDEKLWREHINKVGVPHDYLEKKIAEFFIDRKPVDLSCLEAYECGAAIHFIQKYLL